MKPAALILLIAPVLCAASLREPARTYKNLVAESANQGQLEGIEILVVRDFQVRKMKLSEALEKIETGHLEGTKAYTPKFRLIQKESELGDQLVSVGLKNMSLANVLDIVCELAGAEWWPDGTIIRIQAKSTLEPLNRQNKK